MSSIFSKKSKNHGVAQSHENPPVQTGGEVIPNKKNLLVLAGGNLHAGAHGGGQDAASDILALSSGGLGLDNSVDQGLEVLGQLLSAERNLANGAVDDVGLIETVLDLTSLDLLNGSGHIGGHGASLGGGHQAFGAQDLTETADNTHHIGGSNDDVEIEPVLLGDLLHQLHAADIVSASLFGLVHLGVLGEHQNLAGLAGTVGQNDGTADLLVSVTGVNAELDVDLDGLVKLGGGGLDNEAHGLGNVILNAAVDQLSAVGIFFTSEQCNILLKVVMRNNPPTF